MLPLVLVILVLRTASQGSHTGDQVSNIEIRRPQEPKTGKQQPQELKFSPNTDGSASKAVVECAIKHQRNIQVGSFVPLVIIALGSPPQEFSTILDTGSGDFIVGRTGSIFCENKGANCSETRQGCRGSFNPDKSANTSFIGTLNASFFNGERDQGEFRKTDATIGGVQVPDLQFGLANNGTTKRPDVAPLVPLLGIWPVLGETNSTPTYPNLPERMREVGVIKSNIYGAYLNDFRGSDGSIVFGGVDAAKFTGELKEASLLAGEKCTISSFRVDFSSFQLVNMGANASANRSNNNRPNKGGNNPPPGVILNLTPQGDLPPAFIDTGNAEVLVPPESLDVIAQETGAEISDNGFIGPVKCESLQGKALRFGFNRDNSVIDVPLDMMVVPDDIAQLPPGMCGTIIGTAESLPQGLNIASLGAPMMQAMYIAFDAERSRLLFAPVVFNSTRSDLRELGPEWTGTVKGTGGE